MNDTAYKIITIPAKVDASTRYASARQLRVAAYCRVSTNDEEQLTSYEAQKNYYTDYIMKNKSWSLVDIFADEGITGTSARKRPEFLRMIRMCKRKKIDIVLTKSISRFARNTVDCLNYIRILKELGIAVIFEKENINTLESDSEILITMLGAFAQAESESISANVRWGIRQSMREGKVRMRYDQLYAYRKGADGEAEIIPEEAEVVQEIYRQYLMGASVQKIKDKLSADGIPNVHGNTEWTLPVIRRILTNEKYCGDVLLQKTYVSDCISKKVVKNTGQLPQYLIKNHHKGIVSHETFDAVQTELARRKALKSPSQKNASTGMAHYSSKYALSERLVCGECGTQYRRCVWSKNGKKRAVWRCVSRLDYGTKYCKESPTLNEEALQRSILAALNSVMSPKSDLIHTILDAMEMELSPVPGEKISIAELDRQLDALNTKFQALLAQASSDGVDRTEEFKSIFDQTSELKLQRKRIEHARKDNIEFAARLQRAGETLESFSPEFTEWKEPVIRQLVDTVKVVSAEEIMVYLYDGTEIPQQIIP